MSIVLRKVEHESELKENVKYLCRTGTKFFNYEGRVTYVDGEDVTTVEKVMLSYWAEGYYDYEHFSNLDEVYEIIIGE
jgi:hypothetical protein